MNIFLILCLLLLVDASKQKKPHIIMIVADDLGWNDVSFHGSQQIPTPNIDKLAQSGIILNNYYVLPICTPTRSAIMTGRYPIHTGMHGRTVQSPQPWGVGLKEKFLPQYLKKLGYSTHAVGKWHLGFFAKEYTPTYRGFDSFYGFYSGKADYWYHAVNLTYCGLDLHHNLEWHLGFYAKEFTPTYRGFESFYGYYLGKSDYWDHSDEETYWGLDLHENEKVRKLSSAHRHTK